VVAVGSLVLLLPSIVLGEHLRRGSGRRVARRGLAVVARLCGITFERSVRPEPTAPGPTVYVANHSSPMDIPALLATVPGVRFIAAEELFRIPLLASAMRALGTVPVDRRDPGHGRRQLRTLAGELALGDGADIAVFPEGGIAPVGRRLPFKSGAFSLAIETGSTVVPVAIHGTDRILPPGGRLMVQPGTVSIDFLDPIPTAGLTGADRQGLRDHVEGLVTAATENLAGSGRGTGLDGPGHGPFLAEFLNAPDSPRPIGVDQ